MFIKLSLEFINQKTKQKVKVSFKQRSEEECWQSYENWKLIPTNSEYTIDKVVNKTIEELSR